MGMGFAGATAGVLFLALDRHFGHQQIVLDEVLLLALLGLDEAVVAVDAGGQQEATVLKNKSRRSVKAEKWGFTC